MAIRVEAAAPRILMFYGPPLTAPIVLSDWRENGRFMPTEAVDMPLTDLDDRRYISMALFWGTPWVDYVDAGKSPGALRPEDANQHGRFYPAVGQEPPVITLDYIQGDGPSIRLVDSKSIDVLQKYGVPVRVDAASSRTPLSLTSIYVGFISGVTLVLISIVAVVVCQRRHTKQIPTKLK